MKFNNKLKAEEIYKFGVWLTVFENGDIFISTKGNVHIIKAKQIIDINDNRVKTTIGIEDERLNRKTYSDDELKVIKKYRK